MLKEQTCKVLFCALVDDSFSRPSSISLCLQLSETMLRGLELSKPDDVLRYLSETPFASSQAEPLCGGTINYVFRLYLRIPYGGMRTLIMKHGKGWPSGHETYSFSVERQAGRRSSCLFEAHNLSTEVTDCATDLRSEGPRNCEYGDS